MARVRPSLIWNRQLTKYVVALHYSFLEPIYVVVYHFVAPGTIMFNTGVYIVVLIMDSLAGDLKKLYNLCIF